MIRNRESGFTNYCACGAFFSMKVTTPHSEHSIHNEKFLQSFKDELIRYFNIKKDILFVTVRKTDQEIRELLKEEKQILYLPEFALIKHQGKIIYKFLEDSEIYLLTNNALDKTDL